MTHRVRRCLGILTAVSCLAAETKPTTTRGAVGASFEKTVLPFVAKRCVACHNAKLKSGELNLERFRTLEAEAALKDRVLWERVVAKLRSGEMPPKGIPRPNPADVTAVTRWIESHYQRVDRNARPDPGRVTARRLNRAEYNNTVRDLTGVDFRPADDFPADDSGYGFDNIGDVLSLPPVLMEKYLAAAEKIARAAVVTPLPPMKPVVERYQAERLKQPDRTQLHVKHKFSTAGDYDLRAGFGRLPDGSTFQAALYLDGQQVKLVDAVTQPDKPRAIEARIPVTAGEHEIRTTLLDAVVKPGARPTDGPPGSEFLEVRGPFNPRPPELTENHQRIVVCGHALGAHQPECARKIVARLARRAYRRPATDREIDRLERFVALAQQQGDSFEHGVQVALQAALVSPYFLFRIERDPKPGDAEASHPINDHELATRLAYFLWSSMPDDELDRAAEAGRLRKPGVLEAQIRRMLLDGKARALVENFAGQWLQLRNLETVKPDPDRFPSFDDELRQAMRRETQLFFEAVIKEDRSILDFIDGRFTFLNERLARHYGIPGIEGQEFRRVVLAGRQRSGVLTQASVLTVSSYPTRTSPVLRGKWILENVLNAPPPPPPPGVPNLDEQAVGNTGTLRQQLERHRTDPTCNSCHGRMDPLGFGLENYDAIGAWRTADGKFPVDVAGTLPNGKSFQTPAGLKAVLKADRDAFVQGLTEKMLTYALGRGLERYDRSAVHSISRRVAAGGYRFSRLVEEIVKSLPFQMRRGDGAKSS